MTARRAVTLAAVVAVTAMPACGSSADVDVTLFDYGILAPPSIEAGDHTFAITVEGVAHHTLTVCPAEQTGRCDEAPISFHWSRKPADARDPDVIPDDTNAVVLGAGWTGEVTATLEPGQYRVYCSIVNHAAYGMDRLLTVTPAT